MRSLKIASLIILQVSLGIYCCPVVAQNPSASELLPILPDNTNKPVSKSNDISPEFNKYFLATGDTISVSVQRPPGLYRLGIGDGIAVSVQRFPDLSFQGIINPEGNVIVPLWGAVSLQGLTLQEAQSKIRSVLDRYVINPNVMLSLSSQRPNRSFQSSIGIDGNIIIPEVGKISVQGLTVEEAEVKIKLALSKIAPDDVVEVSLAAMRPVQLTITGEVFKPGIYSAPSAMPRITDILVLAGGTTLKADLREVLIRRKLTDGSIISQKVDLYTSLQNGSSPPNVRLQDGDAIIIPQREVGTDAGYDRGLIARSTLAIPQIKVRILNYASGGVIIQNLPNGSNFVDALGGISLDNTNVRNIALVRFDPEKGKAITQRLDGKKALQGDSSQNVALQDNDVIVVGRNLIGKVTNLLNTITQPFFNVQSFVRFFQNFGSGLFGGGGSN